MENTFYAQRPCAAPVQALASIPPAPNRLTRGGGGGMNKMIRCGESARARECTSIAVDVERERERERECRCGERARERGREHVGVAVV